MKRKIAMFSSTWYTEYTTALITGIRSLTDFEDITLHIFNTYDVSEKTDLVQKEMDILRLPDLSDYDGMLVVYNSVGQYPQLESLVRDFAATGKKVLCIDQRFANQPFIGIDNYQSFYRIVEHMITVHGCRTMNYLGGPTDSEENIQRLSAFLDCLKAHDITPEPDRILQLHFLHSDGKIAYETWKKNGLHLPDAVICASDYMALGYLVSAEEDGYSAPADFKLTGFDNIEEAQLYSPSITSVNRNWEKLGYESIRHLLDMIDGENPETSYYVTGSCCLNESCGCHSSKMTPEDALIINYHSRKQREILGMWSRDFLQRLCSAKALTDTQKALQIAEERLDLPNYVFCLNIAADPDSEESFFDNYTENQITVSASGIAKSTRRQLIPPSMIPPTERVLFFTPLHFGEHNFGYSIIPFRKDLLEHDKHRKITDYVSLSLECTTQRRMLTVMNKRLKALYLQDQLTGLYNRFGYMDLATEYYRGQAGRISIYYLDIDNLKLINDTYGHAMGDKAILGLAESIKTVFSDTSIKVRMGGDEFLVVEALQSEEEIQHREQALSKCLSEYREQESIPFPMTASMGHIRSEDLSLPLEELVHQADTRMYELKQKKKAANTGFLR